MGNVDRTFPMLCFRRVDTTYRMFTVSTLDSIKRRRGKVVSSQSRSAFVRSKSCRIFTASRLFAGIITNMRIRVSLAACAPEVLETRSKFD